MDPVVSTAAEKSLGFVVELLKRQVSYLYYYMKNVEEINKYVKNLRKARESVQHEVEKAERNVEEIEADVQNWLEEVDKKITEFEMFLEDENHQKTWFSIFLFPNNLRLRYHLGRNAHMMTQKIKEDELLKKKFDRVSYQLGPPTAINAATSNIGFESFPSRNTTLEAIVAALEDPTVRKIGVCGSGGVGKTTLVKEVAKIARQKLFKVVLVANVTRNPDLKKIQGELANMLGLSFKAESDIGRADHLRRRLKKEKEHTLVILDDIWEGLDLKKLGISIDDDDDDDDLPVKNMPPFGYNMVKREKSPGAYKRCKVLLTSRFKQVLSTQMDVKETSIYFVGNLNDEEAEMLFKKVAMVPDKSSNPELHALVAKVVKKCGQLPMAIVTVGTTLRNKNYSVWNDELRRLESHKGVLKPMEFSIKLSYDHLESEELKSTFLLCAQMAHRPLMMDLVKYSIGLRIFQGVNTIRETRNRINRLIHKLKDSSLLLDSDSNDRFNMHDMVCDAALSIASKEKNVFVVRNGELDDWPENDELEKYTAISIHNCDIIDELPESVNCSQLRLFHIDSDNPSLKIPDHFFEGMRKLTVLILTGFHFSCLPPSIKCLKNLRMLCLERCLLLGDNLSIIGELKKLRIFSLSESEIEKLPHDFGQLSKLQLFDISNCPKLKIIPPNVMSNMTSLEELYIRKSIIQWEVKRETQHSESATLAELNYLQQLRTLDICIQNAAFFPTDLYFDKLDDYKIVIGDFKMLAVGDFKMPDKYEASRALAILKLKEGTNIHSLKGIKILLRRVENLFLGELNGVQNVFNELNLEGFPCLKHLSIVNNFDIQYIINSMDQSFTPQNVFPNLESMYLYKLENLEKICYNHLLEDSFCKLKSIRINTCARLKSLFSFYTVRLLSKLETIEVSGCRSLKEIVAVESRGNIDNDVKDDMIVFPQLHSLILRSLPEFTGLYTNDKMLSIFQSEENHDMNLQEITMEESNVNVCLSLFSRKVLVPNLESLEISSINIHKIWSDDQPLPSPYFQKLINLKVKDCGSLRYLLSFSMAKSLENLQNLSVSGCDMMENIFNPEDISMDEEKQNEVFPKLKEVKITSMEKLKTIWPAQVSLNSFKSLDSMIIKDCKKLAIVFPHHMAGRYQSLGILKVTNCESVEEIFDLKDNPKTDGRNETNLWDIEVEALPNLKHVWNTDPRGILNFKNIRNVSVDGCHNLKNLLPLSVAIGLEKLKFFAVNDCAQLKEIVARDDEESNESTIPFNYSQLTFVLFVCLPELESFCRGPHAREWPALKTLILMNCDKMEGFSAETTNLKGEPIFLSEKVMSNLESMGIGPVATKWLQDSSYNIYRMRNIKFFSFYELKSAEILLRFLHRIPNLEGLELRLCLLEELFGRHEKIRTVVQLKELRIWFSPFLKNIGFEHAYSILETLEHLSFSRCPRLINLALSTVSFFHLTTLEISECSGLTHLVASSTAKSLAQLASMKIIQCGAMEEIVAGGQTEEEKAEEIVFSKLETLELVSLQKLTSFCSSKKHVFEFPLLEKVTVRECPKMKIFCEKLKSTPPSLQKVNVAVEGEEEGKWYWEGDMNATIQKMFKEKVTLEYTKLLKLSDYPELEQVWHCKVALADNWFGNLRTLEVVNCEFLKDFVIPSSVLPYLKNLEELEVKGCNAVEVIFDINDMGMTKSMGISFRLKRLTLDGLPHLKRVWNKNSQGIVSFQNLRVVSVEDCDSLKALFPSSLAKTLVKLETLHVDSCVALVEIVEKEEAAATDEFVFSSLTKLELVFLPELTCFYPGRHNLECPKLNCLKVVFCDKLEMFTTEFQSHQEAHPEGQVSIANNRQPLFKFEKVIPNMEELVLQQKDAKTLWQAQILPYSILKLKRISLFFDPSDVEGTTFLLVFLYMVPNLESLKIFYFETLQWIFPSQNSESNYLVRDLEGLKRLSLIALSGLKYIGLEHCRQPPRKLEFLYVNYCPLLTKLVHSAASLCNLKELEILNCDGLEYLFTPSTAKSLVQLKTITIRQCESITEIMAKEGDASTSSVENDLIFERLQSVTLDSLPSLLCFYSGNATLQFPRLSRALIKQCPKMITFSHGVIIAPHFIGLEATMGSSDISHFNNDLNTTVKELFQEING